MEYTRKDIAEITQLEPRQIQFYTDVGVVGFKARTGGTRGKARKYSVHHLRQFLIVKELRDYGITFTKIKEILDNLDRTPGISNMDFVQSPDHETYILIRKVNGEIDTRFRFEILDRAMDDGLLAMMQHEDLTEADGYIVINYGRIMKKAK